MEADGHALLGGHNQVVAAAGDAHPAEAVPLVQVNGDKAALPGRVIGGKLGALDHAVFRHHHQVAVLVELRHPDHGADLLLGLQGQQVFDVHAPAVPRALGDLIALELIHPPQGGEEHHIVVAAGDEDLGGHVLVPAVHAVYAPAAPLLLVVVVGLLALYIAKVGHGEDAFLHGDQVLDVHLAADGGDLRAALVRELPLHLLGLVLDDGQPPALALQDLVEVGNVGVQLGQLVFNLQNFQPCQLPQLELADGVGLQVVKAEVLHQRGLGLGPAAFAGPDGGDNLVHNVDGPFQAL